MTLMMILIEVVGWTGVVLLLMAYGLVSSKRLDGESLVYQTLNLVGSACLIINSAVKGAYPSVVVNVVWIGIALATLAAVWWKKRRRQISSL